MCCLHKDFSILGGSLITSAVRRQNISQCATAAGRYLEWNQNCVKHRRSLKDYLLKLKSLVLATKITEKDIRYQSEGQTSRGALDNDRDLGA